MAEARMIVDAMEAIRKDEKLRLMPEIDVTLFVTGGTRLAGTIQRVDSNGKYLELVQGPSKTLVHVDIGSVTHAFFRMKV